MRFDLITLILKLFIFIQVFIFMEDPKYQNYRKIHEFLVPKFYSQETFTKDDFKDFVSCEKDSTFNSYFGKKIKIFLREVDDGYKINYKFRKCLEIDDFIDHMSQSEKSHSSYYRISHHNVIVFDFYLPLTKENELKEELNYLFYLDTIIQRLKFIGKTKLIRLFHQNEEESDDEYFKRLGHEIAEIFIGYSINIVQGRFRCNQLLNFDQASERQKHYQPYLIDETTAIVKFIIPVGTGVVEKHFKIWEDPDEVSRDEQILQIAEKIRKMFRLIFLDAILEIVDGEDEIWVLESGMRTKLHRFCNYKP